MKLAGRWWGAHEADRLAVLIHGATGSAETWWRVAPRLVERGWSVLGLDLRGHGASPRAGGPYNVDDLAGDVRETLVRLLPDGAPDVVWGHSMGGVTTLALAARWPELAPRIIVEDPPSAARGARGLRPDDLREERASAEADLIGFARSLLQEHPAWLDADALGAAAGVLACDTESMAASYEHDLAYRTVENVRALAVPCLLVLAPLELGSVLESPDRDEILAVLKPEDVVELEGGHVLHRDCLDEYIATTLGWLERS